MAEASEDTNVVVPLGDRWDAVVGDFMHAHMSDSARLAGCLHDLLENRFAMLMQANKGKVCCSWYANDTSPQTIIDRMSHKIGSGDATTNIRFRVRKGGDVMSSRQFVRFKDGRPALLSCAPATISDKTHLGILAVVLRDSPSVRERSPNEISPCITFYCLDGGGGAGSLLGDMLVQRHSMGPNDSSNSPADAVRQLLDIGVVCKCSVHSVHKSFEWGINCVNFSEEISKAIYACSQSARRVVGEYHGLLKKMIAQRTARNPDEDAGESLYIRAIKSLGVCDGEKATSADRASIDTLAKYNVNYTADGSFQLSASAFGPGDQSAPLGDVVCEISVALLHLARPIVATLSRWLSTSKSRKRALSAPWLEKFVDYVVAENGNSNLVNYYTGPYRRRIHDARDFFTVNAYSGRPTEKLLEQMMEDDSLLKSGRIQAITKVAIDEFLKVAAIDDSIWRYYVEFSSYSCFSKLRSDVLVTSMISLAYFFRECYSVYVNEWPLRLWCGGDDQGLLFEELINTPTSELDEPSRKLKQALKLPYGRNIVSAMISLAGESVPASIMSVEQAHSPVSRHARTETMTTKKVINIVFAAVFLRARTKLPPETRKIAIEKKLRTAVRKRASRHNGYAIFVQDLFQKRLFERGGSRPNFNKKEWYAELLKDASAKYKALSRFERLSYTLRVPAEMRMKEAANRLSCAEAEAMLLQEEYNISRCYGNRFLMRNARLSDSVVMPYLAANLPKTASGKAEKSELSKREESHRLDSRTAKERAIEIYRRTIAKRNELPARITNSNSDRKCVTKFICDHRTAFHMCIFKVDSKLEPTDYLLHMYSKKMPTQYNVFCRAHRPLLRQSELAWVMREKLAAKALEENEELLDVITQRNIWLLQPESFFGGDFRLMLPSDTTLKNTLVAGPAKISTGLRVEIDDDDAQFVTIECFIRRLDEAGLLPKEKQKEPRSGKKSSGPMAAAKQMTDEEENEFLGKDIFFQEQVLQRRDEIKKAERQKVPVEPGTEEPRAARYERTDEEHHALWHDLLRIREEDANISSKADNDDELREYAESLGPIFAGPDPMTQRAGEITTFYQTRILMNMDTTHIFSWCDLYKIQKTFSVNYTSCRSRSVAKLLCFEWQWQILTWYREYSNSTAAIHEYDDVEWAMSPTLKAEAESHNCAEYCRSRLRGRPVNPGCRNL